MRSTASLAGRERQPAARRPTAIASSATPPPRHTTSTSWGQVPTWVRRLQPRASRTMLRGPPAAIEALHLEAV